MVRLEVFFCVLSMISLLECSVSSVVMLSFSGGPRFGMNDKTLMEDHLKQAHEMFQDPSLAAVQDRATQIAVMQQQQEMARLNQFAVNQQFHHFMGPPPPTSPPMHHQQPPPMPPRPRPEGSQEPSTHFMSGDFNERGQHKSHDQLVIDSWTNEDNEKVNQVRQRLCLLAIHFFKSQLSVFFTRTQSME